LLHGIAPACVLVALLIQLIYRVFIKLGDKIKYEKN